MVSVHFYSFISYISIDILFIFLLLSYWLIFIFIYFSKDISFTSFPTALMLDFWFWFG